jgi:mannose-1-phosphate guanylyltransferase
MTFTDRRIASENERSPWCIILAGGEGVRMRPFLLNWLGENRPKQYCTFVGSRSMLQHTLDRLDHFTSSSRIVTVIGHNHARFIEGSEGWLLPGLVIEQPKDCGTAPGIFLALAYILDRDPSATVLIFPSDHYIYPEKNFLEYVMRAALVARSIRGRLVLLAGIPDGPEESHGWIMPGRVQGFWGGEASGAKLLEVARFYEKTTERQARKLFESGGLWSTMIAAASVETLWNLGWHLLPAMMEKLTTFRAALHSVLNGRVEKAHETLALHHLYRGMEPADFSRDVLQRARDEALVIPLEGIEWSDWDGPERVIKNLRSIGRRAGFPAHPERTTEVALSATMAGTGG